jgi:hypothetical protein
VDALPRLRWVRYMVPRQLTVSRCCYWKVLLGTEMVSTHTLYSYRTHTLYSYTVLIHCTHIPYSYTVLIHCTHTLYAHTVLIHCTHTLYAHTVLIHCTHTLYSTLQVHPHAKCDTSIFTQQLTSASRFLHRRSFIYQHYPFDPIFYPLDPIFYPLDSHLLSTRGYLGG